ncbi:MAG: N-acetylmuramoyl-L-alanine amidase [Archangium sp.]
MLRSLLAASFVFFAACGTESSEVTTPSVNESPLNASFDAAAREYQVPVELLKSIAWVETRVSMRPNLESQTGGVGVMQLSRRGDFDSLSEAAKLTGVSEGALRVDARANIRGAAAVLRAAFDRAQKNDPSLDSRTVGDWYRAVSLYPGIDSATGAADYASDVFFAMEAGFSVGGVTQVPTTSTWRNRAPTQSARRDAVLEYPGGAAWAASPNYSSGRSSYEFVLIHTMQGSYAGTKSWFQNTSSNVSSHYIIRSSDGQITQMVEHKDTAWHAGCYNGRSIGLEHEGFIADPGRWYTDAMYTESAKLTAWICDRHNIPKTRARILGHVEIPSSCNSNGHTDPGSGWNWTRYMQLVTGSAPTTGTGVLIGAIYTGGNPSNRVAGATVTVNGQSVTTGSNGIYQFNLAPGSYTATASKAGFSMASVTRTVVANAQEWGSMEINSSGATGELIGKIFAFNAANPSDSSQAISGATVTCDGATVTTGADGLYRFNKAPGTYTIVARKTGFADSQISRTAVVGTQTWGSMGLTSTSSADMQAPQVEIVFPTAGASLDIGRITLRGNASDDRGAVAMVKVALNGGTPSDVAVNAGAFEIEVLLEPGNNTIEVTATDTANNVGRATSTATFNAGVAGVVHLAGDDATRIEGATVELREAVSGTMVSSVTTDASGAYVAPVMTVPADYLVVVKKAGYRTASETVTVPEDQRLSLNVGIAVGSDEVEAASITFVEPMEGATVATDTVTIYGVVKGFDVAQVVANGVTAELLGAGGFSVTVPLNEGANEIEAVASGVNGQTVSAKLNVTRKTIGGGMNLHNGAAGGCGCSTGIEAFFALSLLGLLRRRRS